MQSIKKIAVLSIILLHSTLMLIAQTEWKGWVGVLIDRETGEERIYTPDEFFGPNGALIPDYDPDDCRYSTQYIFFDTACYSRDITIEYTYQSLNNHSCSENQYLSEIITSMSANGVAEDPVFGVSKIQKGTNNLRASAIHTMYFERKEDVTYSKDKGSDEIKNKWVNDFCPFNTFGIEWAYGGGRLISFHIIDRDNNIEYYEDFTNPRHKSLVRCTEPSTSVSAKAELPTCENPQLLLTAQSPHLKDFHWVDPDGLTIGEGDTLLIEEGYLAKSGMYRVWGRLNPCFETYAADSVWVVIPEPYIHKEIQQTICEGEYYTSPSGKQFTTSGTYYDTIPSNNYCDTIFSIELTVKEQLVIAELSDAKICEGESTLLSPSINRAEHVSFRWTPSQSLNNPLSFQTTASPTVSTEYTLTATDNVCQTSATVLVEVYEPLQIMDLFAEETCKGESVVLSPSINRTEDVTFLWTPSRFLSEPTELQTEASPRTTTKYTLTATDGVCQTHASVYVEIIECKKDTQWYWPPVVPAEFLTPNGDGVHDTWEIYGLENYKLFTIWIYDRFGKLLYRTDHEYNGWDGYYNGHAMPSTDYWYMIELYEPDWTLSGHFTLRW